MAEPAAPPPLLSLIQDEHVLILTSGLLHVHHQWPWTHNLFEASPASEIQPTRPGWDKKDGHVIHNHRRIAMIEHACRPQVTHPFTQSYSGLVSALCLECQQQHPVKGQRIQLRWHSKPHSTCAFTEAYRFTHEHICIQNTWLCTSMYTTHSPYTCSHTSLSHTHHP